MRGPGMVMIAALASLGGCASINPQGSWVDGVQPQDARTLAADMTQFIATVLPPGRSIVAVVAAEGPASNLVEPQLEVDLRARGFGVAPSSLPAPGTHTLRYLISPSDLGLSLRIYADVSEATRLYGRTTTGTLQALGPFVVRE